MMFVQSIDLNRMTSNQSDIRQRQSKRKIFLDESYKSRSEERSTDTLPLLPKKQPSQVSVEQVRELKALLKDEREKYDQLFEQYEQLIEKNNLIEKEYINLKYEHNKELKQLKKGFKDKVDQELKRCIQLFTASIHEQSIWEGLQVKIDLLVTNLQRITEIFLAKSKKYHSKDLHKTIDIIETEQSPKLHHNMQESIQAIRSLQIAMQQKIMTSPSTEGARQWQLMGARQGQLMPSSNLSSKQIVFQDEYYGDLEDYEQLQQKISQRKNFELLKNCNRSSAEIRRKKIFNKGGQFQ